MVVRSVYDLKSISVWASISDQRRTGDNFSLRSDIVKAVSQQTTGKRCRCLIIVIVHWSSPSTVHHAILSIRRSSGPTDTGQIAQSSLLEIPDISPSLLHISSTCSFLFPSRIYRQAS